MCLEEFIIFLDFPSNTHYTNNAISEVKLHYKIFTDFQINLFTFRSSISNVKSHVIIYGFSDQAIYLPNAVPSRT